MKKQYRIKKNEEIEAVIKEKKWFSNACFILYIKKTKETNHFRYAVSVSKKLGNAVVRNRLKRQIRAIIRQFQFIDGIDFFIIVRKKTLEIEFKDMISELEYLFQKQKIVKKRRTE